MKSIKDYLFFIDQQHVKLLKKFLKSDQEFEDLCKELNLKYLTEKEIRDGRRLFAKY